MGLSLTYTAIAIGAAFCIGGGIASIATAKHVNGIWQAKVSKQKLEAASALRNATQKVLEIKRQNAEIRTKLEAISAQRQAATHRQEIDLRKSIVQHGGLRDPWARPCSASALPNTARASDSASGSATGTNLSPEFAELIVSESARADTAANIAWAAYDWAGPYEAWRQALIKAEAEKALNNGR